MKEFLEDRDLGMAVCEDHEGNDGAADGKKEVGDINCDLEVGGRRVSRLLHTLHLARQSHIGPLE